LRIDNLKAMSHTINKHYRYNLFWIYPLIFIVLTVYAIIADKHDKKSASYFAPLSNREVSVRLTAKTNAADSLTARIQTEQRDLFAKH
jgi:hypothetical protein